LRDDIPDEAVCGTDLDLLQAFLAAILTLGPTRTFFEAKRGLGEERSHGDFPGGDVDGFRFVRLGAGDQTFSAVFKVSAYSGDGAKNEKPKRQSNDGKRDEYCDRHGQPPVKLLSAVSFQPSKKA
jgi:hypothetical protein